MAARGAAQILRERIGNEATDALIIMMNEANRSMAEEIVRAFGDRFDRRLTEEISAVRIEMHEGFGELRADMADMRSDLRTEIANGKTDLIRWAFLFWIGQFAAFVGLLAYVK